MFLSTLLARWVMQEYGLPSFKRKNSRASCPLALFFSPYTPRGIPRPLWKGFVAMPQMIQTEASSSVELLFLLFVPFLTELTHSTSFYFSTGRKQSLNILQNTPYLHEPNPIIWTCLCPPNECFMKHPCKWHCSWSGMFFFLSEVLSKIHGTQQFLPKGRRSRYCEAASIAQMKNYRPARAKEK